MTGHMIRIEVFTDFNSLFKLLSRKFGKMYYTAFKCGDKKIGLILSEKFFISTMSAAALVIIIEEMESGKQKIDLISFAGSSGIFKMSRGTHISYIRDVLVFLGNNEIEFHKLMEIDYMSSKKLPEDVRNRLIFILGGSER